VFVQNAGVFSTNGKDERTPQTEYLKDGVGSTLFVAVSHTIFMLPSVVVVGMDSTSPETMRTAGDHSAFAPDVPKFLLGTVACRRTLWLGLDAAPGTHRRSDQTRSPTLAC